MVLIKAEELRDMLYNNFEFVKVNDTEVWCVVDVNEVLNNIPEIDAIPIEWLVNEIHKAIGQECFQLAAYIQFIIDKWRIDNDEKEINSSAEI